ncbi:MAG: carbohydrate kinase [Clostridiales bacterium]|nr:carbohydrate kinase [Clostridiales bacterium]
MKRIVCIGEALIDFIPDRSGVYMKDVENFRRVCGGGPANVAAAIARLGGRASLITKVGLDPFGDYIKETLEKIGVDVSWVFKTDRAKTTLAFVTLRADGERDFSFYRDPGADMLLDVNDIAEIQNEFCSDSAILHFSSVDLIDAPVKYATRKAIEIAKNRGLIISFDPNVRLPLWKNEDDCRKTILEFLPYANVVKISDDEVDFIYSFDKEAALAEIRKTAEIVYNTLGSKGARVIAKGIDETRQAYQVKAVDTTGAGDAFTGAVLYRMVKRNCDLSCLANPDKEEILSDLDFAQKYAAYSVTSKGAIDSYGTINDIKDFFG